MNESFTPHFNPTAYHLYDTSWILTVHSAFYFIRHLEMSFPLRK